MKCQNNIREEVIKWNEKFPVDKWWRDKHKVPFMSKDHREIDFLSQLFEYEEDRLIEDIKQEIYDPYIPNEGNFLKKEKVVKLSEEEMIKNAALEFENMQKELEENG